MAEIMAAGAVDPRLEHLHEVLARPGLSEEAKDGLRRLIQAHPDHPEKALLEHLRSLRAPTAG